ncbi:MAG: DUF6048 family protein [Mediterranea sp.]|jgi:hypothetical protein|nr:DUF6048 family protein [Mediterranea sp.]
MERRISSCFISLLLCLMVATPLRAQTANATVAVGDTIVPLYKGVSVGVDLWGVGSKLLGGDFLSSAVTIDVNLKNRFFPVLEVGYGRTDTWNDNGTHYRSAAPFARIGMDYNIMYKKNFRNYLFVGLRYAMSSFNYDITALDVADPAYGGSIGNPNQMDNLWGGSVPFDHQDMKGSMHWVEIVLGLRAHIYKAWHMGWSVRMKYRTTSSTAEFGNPWYVPGFGKYASNNLGVTYSITYQLPF